MQVGVLHEAQQPGEILARTHGAALHADVLEEQSRELRTGLVAGGGAADGDGAAGTHRPHRMTPCGRPHGLDHRIDLARQPRTGLQRGLRAEFQRFGALVRVARGDEHLQTGGMGELDGRSGHAAARALNEHGVARLDAGGIEQQRVGGQPAGAECGRLSRGEVCGLGEHVGGRHGSLLGHRAGVFLGEDRAALARGHARAIGADERVQHHFAAGLEPMLAGDVLVQNAHGIGAQDHRRLFGGETHTL